MAESTYLIRDVTVIDGLGGDPLRDAAVVVEGDRIAWLGPAAHAPAIGDGRVVEGRRGHTLLPGMINCHAHLCNDGAADLFAQVVNDSVPIATIRAVLNAKLALEAGVTTIRDCGAASQIALEIAKAVDQGLIVGPRVRGGRPRRDDDRRPRPLHRPRGGRAGRGAQGRARGDQGGARTSSR